MRTSLRASLGGWPARVLTVLALVLPIPLCSALGLSLPLPATVARIAAKLVPLANSAVLDASEEQLLGARGSIVRFPGEAPANGVTSLDAGGSPTRVGPHNAGGGGVPRGKVDGPTRATPNATANAPVGGGHGALAPRQTEPIVGPTLPGGSPSTPATGSPPPAGGSDPVPPSAPPTVVDTATAAATTVVGTASATVTTATSTVAGTVAPVVGAVSTVVAPVLPPKKP